MIMKKLLLLLATLFCAVPLFAQDDVVEEQEEGGLVDGIVARQHIKNKKNMEPAYVREANVLWSKTIWRMIDLREKQNLYLYYPVSSSVDSRRSLARVLCDAIAAGELEAYNPIADNEFDMKLSSTEFMQNLGLLGDGQEPDSIQEVNPETGELETKYVFESSNVKYDQIKKFLVKEVWFFDRKYGRLDVRIIGLCPIREYMNEEGTRRNQAQCFWVYYPEAAKFLCRQEAYSFKNDAQRSSIHDCLQMRLFGSYVYKESNVYNNRTISEYAQGLVQNIEADRIENEIFKKEHDMWEF